MENGVCPRFCRRKALKTTPVTPADLGASVIAVPPLARRSDLTLDPEANRALIRHLETGGVRTLMYGGNANFYHLPLSEYDQTLAMLEELAGPDTLVIPSAGPAFGTMMRAGSDIPVRRRGPGDTRCSHRGSIENH